MEIIKEILDSAPRIFTKEILQQDNIGNIDVKLLLSPDNKFIIPTGIKELDIYLNGGFCEGLVCLSGAPSCGKSTLVSNMCEHISANGQQVLYFVTDMSMNEMLARSISRNMWELDPSNAKDTQSVQDSSDGFNLKETDCFNKAIVSFKQKAINYQIIASDSYEEILTIEDVVIIAEMYVASGLRPVVVIDYLQLFPTQKLLDNEKSRLDYMLMQLKTLSIKNGLVVIAISSMNRKSYSIEPSMDIFSGSGGFEFSSNYCLAITNDVNDREYKKPSGEIWNMNLSLLKNKSGKKGMIPLKYYPKYNAFPYAEIKHKNSAKFDMI